MVSVRPRSGGESARVVHGLSLAYATTLQGRSGYLTSHRRHPSRNRTAVPRPRGFHAARAMDLKGRRALPSSGGGHMRMRPKVIISCAVTGAIHTPSMSPHLPVTPEQIVEQAVEA